MPRTANQVFSVVAAFTSFLVLSSWAFITFGLCSVSDVQITHGPILGRMSAEGVGVWARTSRPATFLVHYGLDRSELSLVSEQVSTQLEHDNAGWVQLKKLASNTQYFYEVVLAESPGQSNGIHSFRTLPDADEFRTPDLNPRGLFNFSFEFACGNRPLGEEAAGGVQRPTYVTMLRELQNEISFSILNGDWLYERKRDQSIQQWQQQIGVSDNHVPNILRLIPSVVGVWENYKDYLETDPNLATWHRTIPSFFTFDDHEILNDINGTGEIGFSNPRTVFRDIGVKAWYDYLGWSMFPSFNQKVFFGSAELAANSDVLIDRSADFSKLDLDQAGTLHVHSGQIPNAVGRLSGESDPNLGVYEVVEVLDRNRLKIRPAPTHDGTSVYSIGRLSYSHRRIANCDFFFLDTRSHRQIHDLRNPTKAGVSVIGQRQKQWLKQRMADSDADFFFVVSSVNFMIPHVAPSGSSNKDEAWTSFLEEREELIQFWDRLDKPVFVLTGDLHNSFAIRITDRVWEFASGPHSSSNHSAAHEANRPPNGPFRHGTRECEIRWSSYVLSDLGRTCRQPHYCVVQINNVFSNPGEQGDRWIAFPRPHVVFRYHEGLTGRLAYAESIFAKKEEMGAPNERPSSNYSGPLQIDELLSYQKDETLELPQASPEAHKAWKDKRFGMFIHWGPISQLGKQLSHSRNSPSHRTGGSPYKVAPIEPEIYDIQYKNFNPVKFDADAMMKMAKAAGVEYVVFTAKHHAGFSMFDSAVTEYDIMAAPYGKDITRELADAARARGIEFGFYYSPRDWYHPDCDSDHRHQRYIQFYKSQMTELLENYGSIHSIFFDGLGPGDWGDTSSEVMQMIRARHPDAMVNDRGGTGADYYTPEHYISYFNSDDSWEACHTTTGQWGYNPDVSAKEISQLMEILLYTWGGDGNILLNIGPMGDGDINPLERERFEQIAEWWRIHGEESIRGSRGGPYFPGPWGVSTRKDRRIFLHIFHWGEGDSISFPAFSGMRLQGTRRLDNGNVIGEQVNNSYKITIPEKERADISTTVELTFQSRTGYLSPIQRVPSLTRNARLSASRTTSDLDALCDQDATSEWKGYLEPEDDKELWIEASFDAPVTIGSFSAARAENWTPQHRAELQIPDGKGRWKTVSGEFNRFRFTTMNFLPEPVTTDRVRLRIHQIRSYSNPQHFVFAELELFPPISD